MIKRGTPTPPFEQLAGILRDKILTGELPKGTQLPTILALAAEYEVATATVRKALQLLKDENLVVGRSGYGVFVRE